MTISMSRKDPKSARSGEPRGLEWEDEESSTRTDVTIPIPIPVATKRRALLTVVSGPGTGRVFSVREDQTVLGRGKETHVRLEDPGASREHARIVVTEDGRYLVEDMHSTNGTFVDGRRIERVQLQSGDRINVGPNVVVSFSILDAQAQRITEQIYESSVRDALTRAFNRRYLIDRLASEMAYVKRHGSHLGLVMFDLDFFKRVNDTRGHLAGDEVLREVSALVQRLIRAEDVFARYGGEEFVVLARGIEHTNVEKFAERLRSAIERLEIQGKPDPLHVTVSVGVASVHQLAADTRSSEALLRLADERLYEAKEGGRNRVVAR
jgi:two-component system cell cycle response regulator